MENKKEPEDGLKVPKLNPTEVKVKKGNYALSGN